MVRLLLLYLNTNLTTSLIILADIQSSQSMLNNVIQDVKEMM